MQKAVLGAIHQYSFAQPVFGEFRRIPVSTKETWCRKPYWRPIRQYSFAQPDRAGARAMVPRDRYTRREAARGAPQSLCRLPPEDVSTVLSTVPCRG